MGGRNKEGGGGGGGGRIQGWASKRPSYSRKRKEKNSTAVSASPALDEHRFSDPSFISISLQLRNLKWRLHTVCTIPGLPAGNCFADSVVALKSRVAVSKVRHVLADLDGRMKHIPDIAPNERCYFIFSRRAFTAVPLLKVNDDRVWGFLAIVAGHKTIESL